MGDNTNRPLGLTQRLPRPLNGDDCAIEAKITAIIYIQIRNFDNRPLNTRWPLNAVSLNTSSTVFCFDLVLIKTFCSNDNTYHRLRLERGKVAMQPDNVFCLICRKKKLSLACNYLWYSGTIDETKRNIVVIRSNQKHYR